MLCVDYNGCKVHCDAPQTYMYMYIFRYVYTELNIYLPVEMLTDVFEQSQCYNIHMYFIHSWNSSISGLEA